MGSKQIPRLSRFELRELGRAALNLIAVHESLQRTNWAGAQTSATIVGQSIEAITKVYVRRRHYLPEVALELAAAEQANQQQDTGTPDGDPEKFERDLERAGG